MKRLQANVSDETWAKIETTVSAANEGFSDGSVNAGDVIDFALEKISFDLKELQRRKIDLRKALRNLAEASGAPDLDAIIETLQSLKNHQAKAATKRIRPKVEGEQ